MVDYLTIGVHMKRFENKVVDWINQMAFAILASLVHSEQSVWGGGWICYHVCISLFHMCPAQIVY